MFFLKKGKLILSIAAIVVTASSVLAFRTYRTPGAKHIYGYTNKGGINQHCKVSRSCFTTNSGDFAGNGGIFVMCHTTQGVRTLTKNTHGTLWTAQTIHGMNCAGANINYTKTM